MKGVLLASYGSIYSMDDVERFYEHILHGRKPSDQLLEELKSRFLAIGGKSPFNEISKKQRDKLQKILQDYKVYLAFKHIDPYIEDVVSRMEKDGITKAVGIILSPFYSNYNISDYFKRMKSEKIEFKYIYGYYDNPLLIEAYERRIREIFMDSEDVFYLFSAHSLPEKILPDVYPEQLNYVVSNLVKRLNIKNYAFAYQSAGRTMDKWLGPDVLEVVRSLDSKYKYLISCPIGFIADNLEILYDIDIDLANECKNRNIIFKRMNLFNDDDDFIQVLENIVISFDRK
jgi:ferrochelatase